LEANEAIAAEASESTAKKFNMIASVRGFPIALAVIQERGKRECRPLYLLNDFQSLVSHGFPNDVAIAATPCVSELVG
jgi:hypothetical protein